MRTNSKKKTASSKKATASGPLTAQLKMKRYRQKMRRAGLRPIQIWVPDSRSPDIAKEARRQSLLASACADEKSVLDFIEAAMADMDDWK